MFLTLKSGEIIFIPTSLNDYIVANDSWESLWFHS